MAHNLISEREAIAIAACDVAGVERPVSAETPRERRVYLYACPEGQDEKFLAEELADRIRASSLRHGVDWDRDSETHGLRYVATGSVLPVELRPYTSPEARKAWRNWRTQEAEVSAVIADAATRVAAGEEISFRSESDIEGNKKSRRRFRIAGERD